MHKYYLLQSHTDKRYIIVRTPDYRCTDWVNTAEEAYSVFIPDFSKTYHFNAPKYHSTPINRAAQQEHCTVCKMLTPGSYPELFV